MSDSRLNGTASVCGDERPAACSRTGRRLRDSSWPLVPLLACVAFLSFGFGHFAGAVQKNEKVLRADAVVAERFELVGPNGKPTALLRTDERGGTYLIFFDDKQSRKLTLGVSHLGEATLLLYDSMGQTRASLMIDAENSDPFLSLRGSGSLGSDISLSAHRDGAKLALSEKKGGRLYVGIDERGQPTAGLFGGNDRGVFLSADDDNGNISLTGANRVRRVSWRMLPDGSPEIVLMDEAGDVTSIMALTRDGKTTFRRPAP